MSKQNHLRRFMSVHKFVEAAEKGVDRKYGAATSTEGYSDNWHGTDTFEDAVRFAKYGGWEPEQAPVFRSLFDDLIPKLRKFVDQNMDRFPDVSGDEVNIAAFLDGEPDHMWNWVPQEQEVTQRALCLIVGHSISAGCTSEELFIRGQALIGLVRALALLGYELEVWSEETVSGGWRSGSGNTYSTLTRIHAAGEILDTSALEFALGNPSWLRRLLFAVQEGESDQIRTDFGFGRGKYGGGYGSVTEIQHAGLVNADLQLNLGRTWFGEGRYGGTTQQKAKAGVDWVVSQLKELGVLDKDAELDWEV